MKHTKGPWDWTEGSGEYEIELVGPVGGEDSILYHGANWPVIKANARLIAAAPELLEALEDILANIDGFPDTSKALAAIRKAKGEA